MPAPPIPLKFVWLLGHQHYQRLYLKFWWMTSGVYGLFTLLSVLGDRVGFVSDQPSHFLRILIPVCLLAFYVAMLSGWSRRLSAPSMTASQMAFAILMLGLSYLVVSQARSIFLMILPLVLLFGAFTLPPARCRQLGWFAVAVLGLAMGASVWVEWGRATLRVERVIFLVSAVVLPLAAAMAGRLSAMRSHLARDDVWQSLPQVKVTFSAGIAAHMPHEGMDATVSRADSALYKAKSQGRNCTVAA